MTQEAFLSVARFCGSVAFVCLTLLFVGVTLGLIFGSPNKKQ